MLATRIGERHVGRYDSLNATAAYIEQKLRSAGFAVAEQPFEASDKQVKNIIAEKKGRDPKLPILIVGAHYDSVPGTPGANDNASGVAALLELANRLRNVELERTVQFVFFVNEEPPFFHTEEMGSMVYSGKLEDERQQVLGMISLETIGCYSDVAGSQHYPSSLAMLYPDKGNFIGFVGNRGSEPFLKVVVKQFREGAQFPSEGLSAPSEWPGVGWSDHWSFWQSGYPAIMVTDTAPFRYAHYHEPTDTPDQIDFDRMARVVVGMDRVIRKLAASA